MSRHLTVEFDLVVQTAENIGDGTLFRERWNRQLEIRDIGASQTVENGSYVDKLPDLLPPFRPANKPS